MRTNLSVNVNKIALLRNSRGTNYPNLEEWVKKCEALGADGITVHPRPDERHITREDVRTLSELVTTEFNIEGFPSNDFLKLVEEVKPTQCTLVPDDPNQLTSDHGWDTLENKDKLITVISRLKDQGIRVALFMDPIEQFIEGAVDVGADRIELYTGPYAHMFNDKPERAVEPFAQAARYADSIGLGVNAGHDLNLQNLGYFLNHTRSVQEVSIGHALTIESLEFGLENVMMMYRRILDQSAKAPGVTTSSKVS